MPKIILIHGNGGGDAYSVWLQDVAHQLRDLGLEVVNESFPDPIKAREDVWLPFIEQLGTNDEAVLVGHSSGAVAAMRYAEHHRLLGSVLVSACYTDLGDATEKVSGYYNHSWDWEAIRLNQKWIIQFASPSDPYIPVSEARFIQKHLKSKYHELADRGHFMDNTFPELVKVLRTQLDL
ncbi:MAG TPA: alpha/beta fold hydrolase [Candidatus Saccharimonadia bacterium]|nr:alpha/beta fold hydrolase [Candidatus Saccharimonadia bacterium]